MNDIIKNLEEIKDEAIIHIVLNDSQEFLIKNCSRVDFTIYNSNFYFIAEVVEKLSGNRKFHTKGTLIELNAEDVKSYTELGSCKENE
ncbi:MAG: hypothetical protein EOO53_15255 [Gammaproteobacteria bacterium]|nr:MAG: hypothetical protein EOO53_15255 [Gammaproteobacteria bacterium]